MEAAKKQDRGIKIETKDNIYLYVYGGRGRFTMTSKKSGVSYEYKLSTMSKGHPRYDENTYYVSVKHEHGFGFMGVFKSDEDKYIHPRSSDYKYDSKPVAGFLWLIKILKSDSEFPSDMEFRHMGVCSICGRSLTTPESIKLGIGPVCYERYGNKRLKKILRIKKKLEKQLNKS